MPSKLRYLVSSVARYLQRRGRACPSCQHPRATAVDRKWLVTALRRCAGCGLLYRTPTTSAAESAAFYQQEYKQGATTETPSAEELARLLQAGFAGHEKDYGRYLAVLRALGVPAGAKLFEFGCSWGYGSHQLRQAGYCVDAFDISRPRAEYARDKLGVHLVDPAAAEPGGYDVFFSAHVIEHVPSVAALMATAFRCLKPGGQLVVFTPNGSQRHRARDPRGWHKVWGAVHPQLIDEEYLVGVRAGRPLLVTSTPYPHDAIAAWDRSGVAVIGRMEGPELLFVLVNR